MAIKIPTLLDTPVRVIVPSPVAVVSVLSPYAIPNPTEVLGAS